MDNYSCQFNLKYKDTVNDRCSKCESQLCFVKLIKKEDNITIKEERASEHTCTCNQTLNIQYLSSETKIAPSTTFSDIFVSEK
ncbi:hypothetical protein HZS_309 [Henneguya salminicola]|nr:hypothetical protein HZS_309 [Henneguya salminicola]